MTLKITDTKDFSDKLKQLIEAHTTLKDAGIDPEDPIFDASITGFLDQFGVEDEKSSSIALPPVSITGKTASAYIVRHIKTGSLVRSTLSHNGWTSLRLADEIIEKNLRSEYQVVGLYVND